MRFARTLNFCDRGPGGAGDAGREPAVARSRVACFIQGSFFVSSIRHVGNFRQAQADAWVTVFDATPTNIQAL
jgi:hypothetical protein